MGWSLVKSLLWGLTVLVQLHRHRGCFEEERMGLLEIKEFVMSSPNVTDHHLLPSWVDDGPKSECCEWERVTCNPTTGYVIQLSLQNIRDLDIDCHYYTDFGHQYVAWFLNVSIFETFQELKHLNLSCNGIGSWIENEELLVFEDLEILDLSNNRLNGSLTVQEFKSLSNLSKLKHLDLGGNHFDKGILRSLGALSALTSLKLDSNQMEGPLYDQDLASLRSLEVLNLANNSFNGSLPKCLDLSCNNLIGEIPPELGHLQEIHALNLSHNQLTGSIPKSFSNLTELESLDLSYNRLSREIPPQLIELTFLAVFSVAYNNLSGRTPDMKAQFGTFKASSYDGNPFLCGVPLEKSCSNNKDASPPTPTQSSNVSDEKWYKIDQAVFFTSFSVTYIMFFLGVITILYINPHWRLWCFNLAEDFIYSCYFCVANPLCKLLVRMHK